MPINTPENYTITEYFLTDSKYSQEQKIFKEKIFSQINNKEYYNNCICTIQSLIFKNNSKILETKLQLECNENDRIETIKLLLITAEIRKDINDIIKQFSNDSTHEQELFVFEQTLEQAKNFIFLIQSTKNYNDISLLSIFKGGINGDLTIENLMNAVMYLQQQVKNKQRLEIINNFYSFLKEYQQQIDLELLSIFFDQELLPLEVCPNYSRPMKKLVPNKKNILSMPEETVCISTSSREKALLVYQSIKNY